VNVISSNVFGHSDDYAYAVPGSGHRGAPVASGTARQPSAAEAMWNVAKLPSQARVSM
jgi:hypothetical protein